MPDNSNGSDKSNTSFFDKLNNYLIEKVDASFPALGLAEHHANRLKATQELNDEGKILQEAYNAFAKNGLTADERNTIKLLDASMEHASIQIQKNNGAIITDDNGVVKSTRTR